MAGLIDDEAEAANPVLVARDEETSLLGAWAASAARCGDDFNKARLLIGRDRRHDDPIIGVLLLESAPILLTGFAGLQHDPEDHLPRIGPAILDRALGAAPLVAGEQMREGDRHDRPGIVFLVPAARRAQYRSTLRLRSAERWKPP